MKSGKMYLEDNMKKREKIRHLLEMAKADLEGIELDSDSPEEIAKKYVKNYKERTGKEFTTQAASALKKLLSTEEMEEEDVEEIVGLAKEEGGLSSKKDKEEKTPSKSKKKEEEEERMMGNIKKKAKEAWDAYNEESSLLGKIRKMSGVNG